MIRHPEEFGPAPWSSTSFPVRLRLLPLPTVGLLRDAPITAASDGGLHRDELLGELIRPARRSLRLKPVAATTKTQTGSYPAAMGRVGPIQ